MAADRWASGVVDQVTRDWRAAWDARPPEEMLFHYTDPAGMEGILKSQVLWASHAAFLNDSTELAFARQPLVAVLDELAEASSSESVTAFLERGRGSLLELPRSFEVYVVCFCQDQSLLSQWRAYGRGGFSIGFETHQWRDPQTFHVVEQFCPVCGDWIATSLRMTAAGFQSDKVMAGGTCVLLCGHTVPASDYQFRLGPELPPRDQPEVFLRQAVYKSDEQHRLLRTVIAPVLEALASEERRLGAQHGVSLVPALLRHLRALIVECLFCFKHEAFSEEHEWRLVVIQHRSSESGPALPRKVRPALYRFLPYVELPMPDSAGPFHGKLPISRVVVGPSLHPDLAKQGARFLLEQYGYSWPLTEVVDANVPLRFSV